MKRIAIACIVSAFFCGGALAADTQAAWQGFLTVKAVTSACAGVGGAAVGDVSVSIYRPHIATTDTNSALSVLYGRSAMAVTATNETANPQLRGSGNCTLTGISSRAKAFTDTSCKFSSITTSPATITATTKFVTVSGKLNNFWSHTGCTVTFTGLYTQRLD